MEEKLTLKKFEEASEIVKKVTLNTNLIYSDYFSDQTGNQVYISLKYAVYRSIQSSWLILQNKHSFG